MYYLKTPFHERAGPNLNIGVDVQWYGNCRFLWGLVFYASGRFQAAGWLFVWSCKTSCWKCLFWGCFAVTHAHEIFHGMFLSVDIGEHRGSDTSSILTVKCIVFTDQKCYHWTKTMQCGQLFIPRICCYLSLPQNSKEAPLSWRVHPCYFFGSRRGLSPLISFP